MQRGGAHSPARVEMEVERRHAARHPHPHLQSEGLEEAGGARAPEAARLETRARARSVRDPVVPGSFRDPELPHPSPEQLSQRCPRA